MQNREARTPPFRSLERSGERMCAHVQGDTKAKEKNKNGIQAAIGEINCQGWKGCGDRQYAAMEFGGAVSRKSNCRHSLVGAVDVVNGQDGQVTVITEVTQGDARTSLELVLGDGLLGGIEGNGHGEDVAIGKAVVLNDTRQS